MLAAPSFLSGLTPAELGVVKQRIEARANPDIAKAKAETAKALQETEVGWRAALTSEEFKSVLLAHNSPDLL